MTFTIRAAQLFLICLTVGLVYVVMSRKITMPLMIELGLVLLSFAAVSALDSLLSDSPFSDVDFVAARWLLAGGGFGLIASYVLWRMIHRPDGKDGRRLTDYAEFDLKDDRPE